MYCSSPSLIGENCRLRRAGHCLGSFVVVIAMRLLIGAPIVSKRLSTPQPTLVYVVCSVCLVYLVSIVQRNAQDRPNRPDRPIFLQAEDCSTFCSSPPR